MTGVQTSSSSPLSLSSKTIEVPFSTTSKLTKIRVGREGRADAGLSLGDLMLTSLRKWQHCSKPSQIDAHFGTTMSFRELLLQTIYAAEGFKAMGLAPNDVLAVVSWNRHEMFSAVLGAVCAGLTVACIVPSSTQAEMQHALTLTQAKVVISEPDRIGTAMAAYPGVPHVVLTGQPPDGAKTFLNILRMGEATQPRPDPDTYRAVELGDRSQHAPVILFSSGTTGLPKAVMLRDSSLTLTLANTSAGSSVDEGKASDAMLLLTSPLCWFSGVMNLFWSLQTGSTRVFITHSDDLAVLSAIDKYKITIWVTAPPMLFTGTAFYKSKSNPGYRLDSLATIFVGGSGLNAQLEESIEKDLDCRIVQAYASTETGFICSRSRLKSSASPHGVLGTLSPGVELRLVDVDTGEDIPTDVKNAVGEARIRSKYVMLRYCNNPEETKRAFDEHGFYKTGDLLYENDEGSYVFVDRMKEVIKYKNNPISPAELEMVLLQHSGVKEACVLGRACTASGELPTAFVTRADNGAGASLTEDEVRGMVAEKLADYKRLRGGVIFLDQLPRTVSGKTDRRNLKEMLQKIKEEIYT